jgi:hypothetical protein
LAFIVKVRFDVKDHLAATGTVPADRTSIKYWNLKHREIIAM